MLFSSLEDIVLRIPALLIAITVHEFAHARVAFQFGDSTARDYGRMTLNPLSHLDPLGTLMILVAGFGWAKPVPINPYRFRDRHAGLLWVSFAGPLANFITGFAGLLLWTILARAGFGGATSGLFFWIVWINIALGVFNLIPIPPLDGSKILIAVAPDPVRGFLAQIEPYAPILLLVLILTGAFRVIILPAVLRIMDLFTLIIRMIPGLA
jgi:Zn-dependent protease